MRINDSKGEEPKNAAMNGQRKNLIEVEPQKPVRLLYIRMRMRERCRQMGAKILFRLEFMWSSWVKQWSN